MDPVARNDRSPALIGALLLASGACGLAYQITWIRELRLIFGASTPATATVLAVFMGGLGFGSLWLSRRAERSRDPLGLYAKLELVVAVSAAASPLLLDGARWVYLSLGGSFAMGDALATVVRVFLCVLALGVPVVAMGGTLPAAARAATVGKDAGRRRLALVYGLNTVGAVAGAFFSSFVLLEVLGSRLTLFTACLLNVLVALVARSFARSLGPLPDDERELDASSAAEATESSRPVVSRPALLAAAFATGFTFMLAELVWYRMGAPILGGSTYTFGLILALALAGIGVGSLVCSAVAYEHKTPLLFATTCTLQAALLLLPLYFGDELAFFAYDLQRSFGTTFPGRVAVWTLVTTLLVLPVALAAGFQFPLLLSLLGRGRDGLALDVGQAYAANTVGSILGSLLGGFVLIPALTAPGVWRLGGALLLVVAVPFMVQGSRGKRSLVVVPALLAALAVTFLVGDGPTAVWRHSGIGAGRAKIAEDANARTTVANDYRRYLLEEHDGVDMSVGLVAFNGVSQITNGKSDGNALGDAMTTVGLGLVPALFHGAPKKAFVIGLGTGQTTGALAAVPGMERVDTVELEPTVVSVARAAAAVNFGALENEKVRLLFGDAREALLTLDETYDVIVSEPSNPYRAGVASLFTVELYEGAKRRLNEGGVFGQWLQGYELEPFDALLVVKTLRSVFAHVSLFVVGPKDFILLASDRPLVIDADRLRAQLEEEPFRTWSRRIVRVYSAEELLGFHIAGPRFADAASESVLVLNTDDRTVLEYDAARTVGGKKSVGIDSIIAAARRLGANRPQVTGALDWSRYEEALLDVATSYADELPDDAPPLTRLKRAVALHQSQVALKLTRTHQDDIPAHNGALQLLLLEVQLTGESEELRSAAWARLDEYATFHPADVAWLRLLGALAFGRFDEAPAWLAKARETSEREPWGDRSRSSRVLQALVDAEPHPSLAHVLARELLKGPLPAYAAEDTRRDVMKALAFKSGDRALCAAAFELDEPWPDWRESALVERVTCYEAVRHPLAAAARADLERFARSYVPTIEQHLFGAAAAAGVP